MNSIGETFRALREKRAKWLPLIPLAVMATFPLYYQLVGRAFEQTLAPGIRLGAFYILKAAGAGHVTLRQDGSFSSPTLIYPQCLKESGVGCLALGIFVCLMGFFYSVDKKRMSQWKWALACSIGVLFAYFLNILRFALATFTAAEIQVRYGQTPKIHHLAEIVSGQIGWPIYAVGLSLFFLLLLKTSPRTVANVA